MNKADQLKDFINAAFENKSLGDQNCESLWHNNALNITVKREFIHGDKKAKIEKNKTGQILVDVVDDELQSAFEVFITGEEELINKLNECCVKFKTDIEKKDEIFCCIFIDPEELNQIKYNTNIFETFIQNKAYKYNLKKKNQLFSDDEQFKKWFLFLIDESTTTFNQSSYILVIIRNIHKVKKSIRTNLKRKNSNFLLLTTAPLTYNYDLPQDEQKHPVITITENPQNVTIGKDIEINEEKEMIINVNNDGITAIQIDDEEQLTSTQRFIRIIMSTFILLIIHILLLFWLYSAHKLSDQKITKTLATYSSISILISLYAAINTENFNIRIIAITNIIINIFLIIYLTYRIYKINRKNK